MTFGWVAYLAGFIVATGLVVRWVSKAQNNPDGYVELATFRIRAGAEDAMNTLRAAGIPAELDEFSWRGRGGFSRLLVPMDRRQECLELLRPRMESSGPSIPPRSWAWQRWGLLALVGGFAVFAVPSIFADWPQFSLPFFVAGTALLLTGLLLIALGPMRDRQRH